MSRGIEGPHRHIFGPIACHRFAPERGAPAAWLYGIARRQLATMHRRGHVERRARRRLGMARIELTDAMLERVEAIADAERVDVDVALGSLPAERRDAVRARVLDECSYDEIARAQRINATHVARLATVEAVRLVSAGYPVGIVAKHTSQLAHSSVRYAPGELPRATRLARREHLGRLLPMSRALQARLGRGTRFAVVLGADRTR